MKMNGFSKKIEISNNALEYKNINIEQSKKTISLFEHDIDYLILSKFMYSDLDLDEEIRNRLNDVIDSFNTLFKDNLEKKILLIDREIKIESKLLFLSKEFNEKLKDAFYNIKNKFKNISLSYEDTIKFIESFIVTLNELIFLKKNANFSVELSDSLNDELDMVIELLNKLDIDKGTREEELFISNEENIENKLIEISPALAYKFKTNLKNRYI